MLIVLLVGCDVQPPDVALAEHAVINGALDADDVGVVGLLSRGTIYCTGTLIDDRVVATAAHCVGPGIPDAVFFGEATHLGGRLVDVASARAHPSFVAESPDRRSLHDIAALLLAADAPEDAIPTPPLAADHAFALVAGAELRLVGFGGESPAQGAVGIKRTGFTTIDVMQDRSFEHRAGPARTCAGDSGGPALLSIDGVEYLAGVAAGGDPDCVDYGVHTRVDVYADEFLRHFPGATAQLGERCYQHGNCVSGLCLQPITPFAFAYCSTPCRSDDDCDLDLRCVRDPDGARACRARVELGALGSPCSTDANCANTSCGARSAGETAVCTLSCNPDDQVACPSGYTCAADLERPGDYGCFSAAVPDGHTPDASLAGSIAPTSTTVPRASRGCTAAGQHPSRGHGAGSVPVLILLAFLSVSTAARVVRLP